MIVPKSTIFDINSGTREGTQIWIDKIDKATSERILKFINKYDKQNKYKDDGLNIDYITYIQDVKGFQGISKTGKATKLNISAMLIKIGI